MKTSRSIKKTLASLALIAFAACAPETSRSVIELPVFTIGDARDTFSSGELEITIVEAKVALGPIYFCASALPSDHVCASARLELLEPFVIDLLAPEPKDAGIAEGSSGRIASSQFNFGRSIFAGETLPTPLGESAQLLGGHSARFSLAIEGPGDRSQLVRVVLDLDPSRSGSLRVLGYRTEVDLDESIASLEIRASAYELLADLNYAGLDDEEGELELGPGDALYEAIASRLASGSFPQFIWTEE